MTSSGISVALSGDTALVGAQLDETTLGPDSGSAHVFTRTGSAWTQQQQLFPVVGPALGEVVYYASYDNFGSSVALEGDTALIGAWHDGTAGGSRAGSAYVFSRSEGSWSQHQQLSAPDGAQDDFFGTAVAVSGNAFLIGAPSHDVANVADAGSAYIFRPVPEIVVEQPAGTNVVDGGTVDFGVVPVNTYADKTFTIKNTGTGDLTISQVHSDTQNQFFNVITDGYMNSPVAPGGSTTFVVVLDAQIAGARSSELRITSNDANENPYNIHAHVRYGADRLKLRRQ